MSNSIEDSADLTYSTERRSIGFYPWLICGLGAVFYAYEYLLRISPNVMTEELMRFYQINAAVFAFLNSIYYQIYDPMQPFVGFLMDRYGPRRLLTIGCFVCVVGAYTFGGIANIYMAGAGRFLVGFGSAFAFVGVLKLATIWLPPDRLGMVSGMASALGTLLSGVGGNLLMNSMVVKVGWQETVIASAAIGIVLTLLLWLIVRDEDPSKPLSNAASVGKNDFRSAFRDFVSIISSFQIWINGLVTGLVYLPTTVFAELWGKSYLENVSGFSKNESAIAISVLYLGFAIGAPLSGYISDRIKRRKLPVVVGTFGTFILFTTMMLFPNLPKEMIYLLLFAMGPMYGTHIIAFAFGRELGPRNAAGAAIAATNMICMLVGGVIVQNLIGYLLDYMASDKNFEGLYIYTAADYRYALSVIPIGLFIACILSLLLRETHCKLRDN